MLPGFSFSYVQTIPMQKLASQCRIKIIERAVQSSILTVREPFMEMVYGEFNQSLQTGDVWRGEAFLLLITSSQHAFCCSLTISTFVSVE